MCAGALLSGIIGFLLAQQGLIRLSGSLAERVPSDRHARFLADAWAHTASYGVGIVGGVILAVNTFRRRNLVGVSNREDG